MTRLKILLFLFTLALLGTVLGGSWWYYTRVFHHDEVVKKEIKQISSNKQSLPDPGLKRFETAVEEIQNGSIELGQNQLYDLLSHFPDSTRAAEAKRIIGEINMDYFFSPNQNKDRIDHIVAPGESLALIANKNKTTIEAIMRSNGMMSTSLQPGDHLFIFPADFEIVVSVSKKTLSLMKGERLFKEYQAMDVKLPSSIKPGIEAEVTEKASWYHGNRVQSIDPHFVNAEKWLMTNRSGFSIRAMPKAKVETDNIVLIDPHIAKPASSKTSSKSKQPAKTTTTKKSQSKVSAANSPNEPESADFTVAAPEVGVILTKEDIEELFTIVRTKTPITIAK